MHGNYLYAMNETWVMEWQYQKSHIIVYGSLPRTVASAVSLCETSGSSSTSKLAVHLNITVPLALTLIDSILTAVVLPVWLCVVMLTESPFGKRLSKSVPLASEICSHSILIGTMTESGRVTLQLRVKVLYGAISKMVNCAGCTSTPNTGTAREQYQTRVKCPPQCCTVVSFKMNCMHEHLHVTNV